MDASLTQMLQEVIAQANDTQRAAVALGNSLIPMLPFKVGDEIHCSSSARMRVERIRFDMHCYMKAGAWLPGFEVLGPQMIGQTLPGSTRARAVFDLQGFRVTFS